MKRARYKWAEAAKKINSFHFPFRFHNLMQPATQKPNSLVSSASIYKKKILGTAIVIRPSVNHHFPHPAAKVLYWVVAPLALPWPLARAS
jgi:hypothetical protein